jgi:phage shock protein PspC (stress-responsive transcriptional regulator)
MERVVTINLNGNPYQLEEPAYDALRAYISRAETALGANPDKAEIVRDLQQAIADKCNGYLSPSKSVISLTEMNRIIEEMGPVEGESAAQEAPRAEEASYDGPRKRLYRIKEGANIAGVCTGIAAYFDLDVNIIRLLFIIAAIATSGGMILIYIAMMFLIPSANTSAEWAAARGVPFNAQEIIDRAKHEYRNLTGDDGRSWRTQMRAQRRAWNAQMRSWDQSWRSSDHGAGPSAAPAQPAGYVTRVFAGFMAFVFSIITAALFIAFIVAFFSLLGAGSILSWTPPADVPIWLAIVVLCVAYAAISAPFSALRKASYATVSGQPQSGGGDGIVTLIIVAITAWFAWMYLPEAREMMEGAYLLIRDFATHWTNVWN